MAHPLLLNPTTYEAGLMSALMTRQSDGEARKVLFENFAKTGLPHRRMEAWKWTDLRNALSNDGNEEISGPADAQASFQGPSRFSNVGAFTITLDKDGAHWGSNVPAGVTLRVTDQVANLQAIVADHPMATLNASMAHETIIIAIARDTMVHAPIHIRRTAERSGHHARILLSLDDGASASLLETLEETDTHFFDNVLTEIRMGEGAHLSRTLYCDGGDHGVDMSLCAVELDASARFSQYALLNGAKSARAETRIHFTGEGAEASLFSASMLGGHRHSDQTSHIIHDAENCVTTQQHKSVLRDNATGVFQGKFLVERSGQKTDANMQANAMLLSDRATVNHKPELEIYADDVECAHGSTSGALDEDAIFYMRQRGLSEAEARSLLVEAFLAEIFDEMDNEGFAEIFRDRALNWLSESAEKRVAR